MSENTSNKTNLETIISIMDETYKAERYGYIAASATRSYAYRMALSIIQIEERQHQLSEMDERHVPKEDQRRERVSEWLKQSEQRLDREQELYNWFRNISLNEGVEEFAAIDAQKLVDSMKIPETPKMEAISHHAKCTGCSMPEAMEHYKKRAEQDAKAITEIEEVIRPLLQQRMDSLKHTGTLDKLAVKFGATSKKAIDAVLELNDYEARQIAELIEKKAEQYAERAEIRIDNNAGRTSRQRRYKEATQATKTLLDEIVKTAGKFADELTHRIDTGVKREGETTYDSTHGTKQVIS